MSRKVRALRGRGVSRAGRLVASGLLALAAGGCLPTPATTQGRAIVDLWVVFGVAAALVGIVVWGLVTWSIVRYRAPGRADLPPQTHGHLGLEITWTAIPVAMVIGLFLLTFRAIGAVDTPPSPPGVSVKVTAFTWQWRFDYEGSNVSLVGLPDQPPEMVVPVGEMVHVTLVANDVDHAFYVPAFLFKRDAIPGHSTDFDFTVDAPGVYPGQCAEFCGLHHDTMRFTVRAVDRASFDAWLAAATSPAPSPGAASPVAASPGASAP